MMNNDQIVAERNAVRHRHEPTTHQRHLAEVSIKLTYTTYFLAGSAKQYTKVVLRIMMVRGQKGGSLL